MTDWNVILADIQPRSSSGTRTASKSFPENENIEIISEGHVGLLIIHSVDSNDCGSYTCEVVNPFGSTKSTAAVTVTDVRCHFESSFSENVEVKEGRDIEFCCTVSDEDGKVLWYKDGKPLKEDDRVIITSHGRQRTLKILSAKETDYGTYGCETSDGRNRTEGELVVKADEPNISTGPQDLTVSKLGTDAKLHCEFTRPPHKVLWYKNGQEIWPQSDKYSITTSGNTSTLEIRNIEKNDIGQYSAALSEKRSFCPSPAPSSKWPLKYRETSTNSTILSWNNPEQVNGAPITGFIIERKAVDSNRWRPIGKTNATTLQFEATDLFSGLVYVFRVIAVNSVGEGPPSQSVDVLTKEDEESNLDSSESSLLETPSPPEAVFDGAKVMLSWSAVPDANAYQLERQCDAGDWLEIAKVESTNFADSSLLQQGSYCYRVIAKGSAAESMPSGSSAALVVHADVSQGKDKGKHVGKKEAEGESDSQGARSIR
ncbi:immunoglobulin domain protein [Cooperia oncophora]